MEDCPSRTSERGVEGYVCVFITAGPIIKLCARGWRGYSEGHVLRGTTSRGMCGLVCPSRTSVREGEGYCVKGGWREGEERVEERVRRSVNPIPNPDPDPTQAPQMSLKEA